MHTQEKNIITADRQKTTFFSFYTLITAKAFRAKQRICIKKKKLSVQRYTLYKLIE